MMHLYAKLAALSLEENMYTINTVPQLDDLSLILKEKVCRSNGPDAVQMFADSWAPPTVSESFKFCINNSFYLYKNVL